MGVTLLWIALITSYFTEVQWGWKKIKNHHVTRPYTSAAGIDHFKNWRNIGNIQPVQYRNKSCAIKAVYNILVVMNHQLSTQHIFVKIIYKNKDKCFFERNAKFSWIFNSLKSSNWRRRSGEPIRLYFIYYPPSPDSAHFSSPVCFTSFSDGKKSSNRKGKDHHNH